MPTLPVYAPEIVSHLADEEGRVQGEGRLPSVTQHIHGESCPNNRRPGPSATLVSRDWKSRLKTLAGAVSDEDSPWLGVAAFPLCPHMASQWNGSWHLFLSSPPPVILEEGPALLTSVHLSYFFKSPVSKYGHTGSEGSSIWIWGARNSACNVGLINNRAGAQG